MSFTRDRVDRLEALALEELIELRDRVDRAIKNGIETEKQATLAKLAQIERYERRAMEKDRGPLAGRHLAPKYRDPVSGATWSGRGKLPRWMTFLIEQGARKEDFRIAERSDR